MQPPTKQDSPAGRTGGHEADVGRILLASETLWVVLQDEGGAVTGCSTGLGQALGRRRRLIGQSYWEVMKPAQTALTEKMFHECASRSREEGRFAFPPTVREVIQDASGPRDVTWNIHPFRPAGAGGPGILRVTLPESGPRQGDAWEDMWGEDVPVLLWEADETGAFTRVSEGLRRLAGVAGDDVDHAAETTRRCRLPESWAPKIRACLMGGLSVDDHLIVRGVDADVPLRCIGMQAGRERVRGWAITTQGEGDDRAQGDLQARVEKLEQERATLKGKLEALVRAMSEAERLAPGGRHALGEAAEWFPGAIFLLDREGRVLQTNSRHSSIAAVPVREGAEFAVWLLHAAGGGEAGKKAAATWHRQVAGTLSSATITLLAGEGQARQIEFSASPAGEGRLAVFAREVAEEEGRRHESP